MKMLLKKQDAVIRPGALPSKHGSFLQPLAVSIVSAILVALILVMGYLDIKRSEANLLGFMEDQALTTISVLLRQTEDNLKSIAAVKGKMPYQLKSAKEAESAYSIRLFFETISTLAKTIDADWKEKKISDKYLADFMEENHFWYVAILNRQRNVIHASSPLDTGLLPQSDLLVNNRPATTLELLDKLYIRHDIGYTGFHLQNGGDILLVICQDLQSRRYWNLKVSVERALAKMGEGHGITYLQVFNNQGNLLGGMGQAPEVLSARDLNLQSVINEKKKIRSKKVNWQESKILDIAAPFVLENPYMPDKKISGMVRIGLDRGSMDQIIEENRRNILVFLLLVVGIALLSMTLFYYDQNRHLAGIIEMERRLEKAERLSSLGQLAAGVAHEIRNPLNAISMAAQRLKRDYLPADETKAQEFQGLSTVIRDEIRRLNDIIEEFLTFSTSRRLELKDFSITEILQKIVSLLAEEAKVRGITLETKWQVEPAIIPMDINKLQQAILNFIKNAMESIIGEGKIVIAVGNEGKKYILVSITDTGCGMTAEEIEKIFSPEFTTKEKGLGLGVPLATEIIRGHGGDLRVVSRKGAGTTFEILLPRKNIIEKP